MKLFIVTRKSDGVEVYRYSADEIIEWNGMELAEHDHTEYTEPVAPEVQPDSDPAWFITIGAFFDRFGQYKLPILASSDPIIQAFIKDASVRKYMDLKGRKADLNQAMDMVIAMGFPVDKAAILDVQPNQIEVYNG